MIHIHLPREDGQSLCGSRGATVGHPVDATCVRCAAKWEERVIRPGDGRWYIKRTVAR